MSPRTDGLRIAQIEPRERRTFQYSEHNLKVFWIDSKVRQMTCEPFSTPVSRQVQTVLVRQDELANDDQVCSSLDQYDEN